MSSVSKGFGTVRLIIGVSNEAFIITDKQNVDLRNKQAFGLCTQLSEL